MVRLLHAAALFCSLFSHATPHAANHNVDLLLRHATPRRTLVRLAVID